MVSFRVWRQRSLWRLFHWVAAAWVFATFVVRLPIDLLWFVVDLVWVNLLKNVGMGHHQRKACLLVDALSGDLCCAVSRRYANRWLLRLVCPSLGRRQAFGSPYSLCTVSPDAIRPFWGRTVAVWGIGLVLAMGWQAWPALWDTCAVAVQGAQSRPMPYARGRQRPPPPHRQTPPTHTAAERPDEPTDTAQPTQRREAAPEAEPLLERACRGLFEQGKFGEARDYGKMALTFVPSSVPIKVMLAKCLWETNDRAQAKAVLRELLTHHPGLTGTRLELASWYDQDGEAPRAEIEYRKAIEVDPKCVKAHLWLAEAYLGRGDVERAFAHSRAATAQVRRDGDSRDGPRSPAPGPHRVWLPDTPRQRRQDPERQATAHHPSQTAHVATRPRPPGPTRLAPEGRAKAAPHTAAVPHQALRALPTRLPSAGGPQQPPGVPAATEGPRSPISVDAAVMPRVAVAQTCTRRIELMHALAALARGDARAAQDVAGRLSLQGDLAHAGLALAFVHESRGEIQTAREGYERVLGIDAANLTAMANLAALLVDEPNSRGRVLALADLPYEREPGNVRFADLHAWVQVRFGSHAEGLSILQGLAAQHPSDSLIRLHLGMAYLGVGNYRKAKAELEAVVELNADAADVAKARGPLSRLSGF